MKKSDICPYEVQDITTGEVVNVRAHNHYEHNDGVPKAPHVDLPRPTVRQRIENLLNRGVDPLAAYVGSEGIDMEVPDDPEAPLTDSEANYLDVLAEELAEQAPLPDEGMPRNAPPPPAGDVFSSAATGGAPGEQSEPEGDQGVRGAAPAKINAPVSSRGKSA